MILVSACLAGVNCRYDGKNTYREELQKLIESGKAVLVCPEQLGGLSTPRNPAEIRGDLVIDNKGNDVTEQFTKGAHETMKIAKLMNCKAAILKKNSPSCGFGEIYDGTFSGIKKKGNGLTGDILDKHGIKVFNEENFHEAIKEHI
ncbi:hypothetical protein D3C76_545930 [compost metagenome]